MYVLDLWTRHSSWGRDSFLQRIASAAAAPLFHHPRGRTGRRRRRPRSETGHRPTCDGGVMCRLTIPYRWLNRIRRALRDKDGIHLFVYFRMLGKEMKLGVQIID